jgi:hypothetical protein
MNETVGAEQTLFVRAMSTFSSRLKKASPRPPRKIKEDWQMWHLPIITNDLL